MRCARAPVYGGGEGAVAEILAARYVGAVILHLPAITVWMVQKQQFMGYKQQQLLVRTLNSSATNNLLRCVKKKHPFGIKQFIWGVISPISASGVPER